MFVAYACLSRDLTATPFFFTCMPWFLATWLLSLILRIAGKCDDILIHLVGLPMCNRALAEQMAEKNKVHVTYIDAGLSLLFVSDRILLARTITHLHMRRLDQADRYC